MHRTIKRKKKKKKKKDLIWIRDAYCGIHSADDLILVAHTKFLNL